MNSLSWLLYAINLLGPLSGLFAIFAMAWTVFCIICLIGVLGNFSEASDHPSRADESLANAAWWTATLKKYIAIPIILWTVFVLMPSTETAKLIAASEVAEYLVNTETGKGVIDDLGKTVGKTGEIAEDSLNLLHQYIKKELNILTEETKPVVSGDVKT